jgi:hypothetical protein
MEARPLGLSDSFDEAVEELTAIALVGTLSLSLQDGDELGDRIRWPHCTLPLLPGTTGWI